jgi:two-component system NarL family response regulator
MDIRGASVSGSLRQPLAGGSPTRSRLGSREREVLQLVAEGLTSSEIAQRLMLSTRTVDTHRRNIMRKLGLHSVAELTKFAITEGMTTLES